MWVQCVFACVVFMVVPNPPVKARLLVVAGSGITCENNYIPSYRRTYLHHAFIFYLLTAWLKRRLRLTKAFIMSVSTYSKSDYLSIIRTSAWFSYNGYRILLLKNLFNLFICKKEVVRSCLCSRYMKGISWELWFKTTSIKSFIVTEWQSNFIMELSIFLAMRCPKHPLSKNKSQKCNKKLWKICCCL